MPGRIYSVTYDLEVLDQNLQKIGELTTTAWDRSTPTITNNINRTIKRSLDGLELLPRDAQFIDPVHDRLRVMGTLDGVAKSLGVFMWTDPSGLRSSYGVTSTSSLVDLNGLVDQPIGRPYSLPPDSSVITAITALANEVGIVDIALEPSSFLTSGASAWPSSTSRASIMTALANAAGFYSPFFNNAGTLVAITPPALTSATLIYSVDKANLIAGTLQEYNDLLSSPNRWVVESVGANDAPIWAAYDIPADKPHSYANRGFYITTVIQGQGVESTDDALQMATAAALSDDSTYQWAEFDSPPSHDHDTFNVVGYLGTIYREQEWSLPLKASATMHHSLRRHYQ